MQPVRYDVLNHGHEGTPDSRSPHQMMRDGSQMPRDNRRLPRNQPSAPAMRPEDSWIEVSSQPSSSSLSSAETNDEIVTTGLRVDRRESSHRDYRTRRRRFRQFTATQVSYSPGEPSLTNSSQDEYEESESESDRVLSSPNDNIAAYSRGNGLLLRTGSGSSASEPISSSDDDDRSTALAMHVNSSPFVPQPNVFSHPPASQLQPRTRATHQTHSNRSMISNSGRSVGVHSNSTVRTARRRQQHGPYNVISPSYQADHDAALRASLSTLLSCAAAARGLPKDDGQPTQARLPPDQSSSFRLVSESVVLGDESGEGLVHPSHPASPSTPHHLPRQQSSAVPFESPAISKSKNIAGSPKVRAPAHSSPSKRTRRGNFTDSITGARPTIMTWVLSAGVVVIFSAISFSAGYVLGREVGRIEAGGGLGSMFGGSGQDGWSEVRASTGCGKEAVRGGLRRLQWGAVAAGSGVNGYS